MDSCTDQGCLLLAARYVRRQAKRLAGELDGVRKSEDIECVHRARIASRRLRSALRMFRGCFDAEEVKRWRRRIRRVTDELGDARDKDVQIEFLCDTLQRLTEKTAYGGIARLMVRLQRQRERLQAKVVRAVDRLDRSGVLGEMRAAAKRLVAAAKVGRISVQSPCTFSQTEQQILQRLNELMSDQDSLADPQAKQRHHAMRIAAKRLRYTVEIARPVYPGRLKSTLAAVKNLQGMLGEIHDCDVWLEQFDAYAKKQRKRVERHRGQDGPFSRPLPGIEYLKRDRRETRERVFRELVGYWRQLEQRGLWEDLANTVGSPADESFEGRSVSGGPEAAVMLPAE